MPNPAVHIIVWATLVIALQMAGPAILLAALTLLLVSAMACSAPRLLLLFRRTRWIMISLMLIYAYSTPGVAVFSGLGEFGPTNEGLQQGLLQLGRLASVLASLSILLSRLDQQKLISGLHTLAYPLCLFGVSRERIAVRLALTLLYAETAMLDTAVDWRASMEDLLAPISVERTSIEIPAIHFTLADCLLLVAAACASLVLVQL